MTTYVSLNRNHPAPRGFSRHVIKLKPYAEGLAQGYLSAWIMQSKDAFRSNDFMVEVDPTIKEFQRDVLQLNLDQQRSLLIFKDNSCLMASHSKTLLQVHPWVFELKPSAILEPGVRVCLKAEISESGTGHKLSLSLNKSQKPNTDITDLSCNSAPGIDFIIKQEILNGLAKTALEWEQILKTLSQKAAQTHGMWPPAFCKIGIYETPENEDVVSKLVSTLAQIKHLVTSKRSSHTLAMRIKNIPQISSAPLYRLEDRKLWSDDSEIPQAWGHIAEKKIRTLVIDLFVSTPEFKKAVEDLIAIRPPYLSGQGVVRHKPIRRQGTIFWDETIETLSSHRKVALYSEIQKILSENQPIKENRVTRD